MFVFVTTPVGKTCRKNDFLIAVQEIQSYYDDILTEEERITYKHDNSSFTAADSINSPPTTNPCTLVVIKAIVENSKYRPITI